MTPNDGKGTEGTDRDETRSIHLNSDPIEIARCSSEQRYRSGHASERIGHFHVRRVLATGGMGIVYEATQDNPRRVVAIKLMKHGVTSRAALRRFEYEAQVLARLRHPGIAQVYEAGTHDDGSGPVPYFAMEYIPNAHPITEFAKLKRLSLRRRLELFAHACDAVHHGHQKGIIHRDLKPANILVDAQGDVKIIDFGVARGTDSDLAMTTLQTDVGQLIGTLQYMSPEQCDADPHDIDIRSDVYSLGVVLYELLADRLPYDVSRRTLADSTRAIREQPPTRMSAADPTLRGDVETLVFKALEKERDRRYQSALELAQDIRRYLAGEAIIARPPSLPYQIRVFARRNRALFLSAAVVFAVLLVGTTVSTALYIRAERERVRVVEAEARTDAINKFLVEDMLTLPDPSKSRGQDFTVREALEAAAKKVDAAFVGQPTLSAALHQTIGQTYFGLGLYNEAEVHLASACSTTGALRGESHPDTLACKEWQALLLYRQGRYAEGEELARNAMDTARRAVGPGHPLTLRLTLSLAASLSGQGKCKAAEEALRQASNASRIALGNESTVTLKLMNGLAAALGCQNKNAEEEGICREALLVSRRVLGTEHPDTLRLMTNLGLALGGQKKYAEEEAVEREALSVSRQVLGESHPDTLRLMTNLGAALGNQGRYAEAEKIEREALAISRSALGKDHRNTLTLMTSVGMDVFRQGNLADAITIWREALEVSRRVLGEEHPDTLQRIYNLAVPLSAQDSYAEVESLEREAMAISHHVYGPNHRQTRVALSSLANVLSEQQKFIEAEPYARESYEAERKASGAEAWDTLAMEATYAFTLWGQQKYAEARDLYLHVLQTAERNQIGDPRSIAVVSMELARCLTALGDFGQAEDLLRKALVEFPPEGKEYFDKAQQTLRAFIDLYRAWGKQDLADDFASRLASYLERHGRKISAGTVGVKRKASTAGWVCHEVR